LVLNNKINKVHIVPLNMQNKNACVGKKASMILILMPIGKIHNEIH